MSWNDWDGDGDSDLMDAFIGAYATKEWGRRAPADDDELGTILWIIVGCVIFPPLILYVLFLVAAEILKFAAGIIKSIFRKLKTRDIIIFVVCTLFFFFVFLMTIVYLDMQGLY
jgi:hypothetical protein